MLGKLQEVSALETLSKEEIEALRLQFEEDFEKQKETPNEIASVPTESSVSCDGAAVPVIDPPVPLNTAVSEEEDRDAYVASMFHDIENKVCNGAFIYREYSFDCE